MTAERTAPAIGHLDTGVDASHTALAGKVAGFLYVNEDGVPEPERASFDSGTHGTHTAGIVCSAAPEARIYCASVIEGGKTPLRILAGLEWLLEQPIRILHMPLGVRGYTPLFVEVIEAFRARGVLPVAAIGNGGSSKYQSPGGYDRVLSVGACDDEGAPAKFSGSLYEEGTERCCKPDVLAPGVDVLSAAPGGEWLKDSGTSMACARVAGIAAALWREKGEASVDEIEAAIVRTASPLGEESRHRGRAGSVDIEAARRYLLEGRYAGEAPRSAPKAAGAKFVDPRLSRKMMFSSDDEELEAILVGRRGSERGIEAIVDGCARAMGSPPASVRRMLGGSICVVRGEMRLISAIAARPEIAVAQSTEVDLR
jgi:subtilisin